MEDNGQGPSDPGPSNFPLRRHGQPLIAMNGGSGGGAKTRKRPARLALAPPPPSTMSVKRTDSKDGHAPGSRSVPASPNPGGGGGGGSTTDSNYGEGEQGRRSHDMHIDGREDLRDTLRGAPRRRPSVLFTQSSRPPQLSALNISATRNSTTSSDSSWPNSGPPMIWQDPSEHILSGNGSSLQHARSSYAAGPIEVLPGLFLGDEFNACDERGLAERGITTILNVAKETTLPCQEDNSSRDLGFLHQSTHLSQGLEKRLTLHDEAATPTSSRHFSRSGAADAADVSSPPLTAITERFFTPLTSSFSQIVPGSPSASKAHLPTPLTVTPSSRPSSLYLRNTSSTPNLQAAFEQSRAANQVPGAYRTADDSSDEDGEEGESEATSSMASNISSQTDDSAPPSPSDEHKLSPSDFSVTTPLSSTFSRRSPATGAASTASSSSGGSFTIALPSNAVALSVPPSPHSGRTWPIRYVKLPWTHDETELASPSSTGGFVTGCAIIADALGIDLRNGQMTLSKSMDREEKATPPNGRGGVLVHCQCGVSRSATLVIAFVMQAAAYEYDFARTRDLTGMHDCYEMVKSVSSSISPNISLIYQLVEWERLLSSQVALHQRSQNRDALTADALSSGHLNIPLVSTSAGAPLVPEMTSMGAGSTSRRWGKEVMDEEDWMRMRAEEESKDQKQEEAEREEKMREVRAREAVWRAARDASEADKKQEQAPALKEEDRSIGVGISSSSSTGVGARRKKPSPSLTLLSSSKANADRILSANVDEKAEFVNGLPPSIEEQQEEDEADPMSYDAPLTDPAPSEEPNKAKSSAFQWLQRPASSSSSRPTSRPGSGYGNAAFGLKGQSAAERRMKHKRTFSAEVPDWNARQALLLTRSKTEHELNAGGGAHV